MAGIVDQVTDILTGQMARYQPDLVEAGITPEMQQKKFEDARVAELQASIRFRIEQIESANPNPSPELAAIIQHMKSNLGSRNPHVLALTLVSAVITQTAGDESKEADDLSAALAATYEACIEDFKGYSKTAQRFISQQFHAALSSSPTLQAMYKDMMALTPETRAAAESQIGQNFRKLKELSENPKMLELYGQETLDLIKDYKLARDPQFNEIAAAMERGEDRGTVTRLIASRVAKQVALGDKVRDEMMPKLSPDTQEHLKKIYGEPVNMSAVIRDLHQLSTTERNDILQAYAANGKDLNKLTEHQRNAIHLLSLGVGVEAGISLQALNGVARDVNLQKLISNPELDPDGKKLAAAISDHMRDGGSTGRIEREKLSIRLAELVRTDPQARELDLRGVAMKIKDQSTLDASVKDYAEAYIKGTLSPYEASRIGAEKVSQEGQQWSTILANNMTSLRAVEAQIANVTFPPGTSTDGKTHSNGVPPEGAPVVASAKPLPLRADGRPVG